MEKKDETKIDAVQNQTEALPESNLIFITKRKLEGENSGVDELNIDNRVSGVYCNGVQYYDLNNIRFINNTGIANLISLMRSLLKKGVVVKFVNANNIIRDKIKSFGLEKFINLG